MEPRLIVIDGVDASGKATQTALLRGRLEGLGREVVPLSFPDYASPASQPVRMYLAGEFGYAAFDVNPYAASVMYAVDRYASYKKTWGADYAAGRLLLCDRYTTSNAIHQGSKLKGSEREEFFRWLYELEFDRMGLPRPDGVIFLDVPPDVSLRLMQGRPNKATGGDGKDIHEADRDYLFACYDAAKDAARFYGWTRIDCTDGAGNMREVSVINDEIFAAAAGFIK